MQINIQFVKIKNSDALAEFINQQLEKLQNKYEWLIRAEVFIKWESQAIGKDKICEIELSAPGPRIYAEARADNFELAVKNTVAELEQQLKKRKAVFQNH
ncbi:MAG: ribosome-associated translation inhibitor RaiA [Salegentibacter sp.]|uniref:ribosome hibernation-promoting factor, HPF/YfiA family n=1 Tax=Salegentibacter sp. TaxID=1903072 RepID=UPI00286FE786|nr:ribosome-associated translation inhibitor RaiA [Salegentibacter sp.]MDR9456559.1 ribosome-associated translation inhibitor RaiA [Salegentibacter sp.]